jgi:hypothetical protein
MVALGQLVSIRSCAAIATATVRSGFTPDSLLTCLYRSVCVIQRSGLLQCQVACASHVLPVRSCHSDRGSGRSGSKDTPGSRSRLRGLPPVQLCSFAAAQRSWHGNRSGWVSGSRRRLSRASSLQTSPSGGLLVRVTPGHARGLPRRTWA